LYIVDINSDNEEMAATNVFFTADTHYSHANIIKYCNRPFANAAEMNRQLVDNWNAVVSPSDIVFHLADVTLGGISAAKQFFKSVHGRIYVLGYPKHHDKQWLAEMGIATAYASHMKVGDYREMEKVAQTITSMDGYLVSIIEQMPTIGIKTTERNAEFQYIALSHFPQGDWDRKYHGSWHLHGHSHGNYIGAGKVMDVGVDCTHYAPIDYARVCKVMEKL